MVGRNESSSDPTRTHQVDLKSCSGEGFDREKNKSAVIASRANAGRNGVRNYFTHDLIGQSITTMDDRHITSYSYTCAIRGGNGFM